MVALISMRPHAISALAIICGGIAKEHVLLI